MVYIKIYIYLFLLTIFGPINYGPPAIAVIHIMWSCHCLLRDTAGWRARRLISRLRPHPAPLPPPPTSYVPLWDKQTASQYMKTSSPRQRAPQAATIITHASKHAFVDILYTAVLFSVSLVYIRTDRYPRIRVQTVAAAQRASSTCVPPAVVSACCVLYEVRFVRK